MRDFRRKGPATRVRERTITLACEGTIISALDLLHFAPSIFIHRVNYSHPNQSGDIHTIPQIFALTAMDIVT